MMFTKFQTTDNKQSLATVRTIVVFYIVAIAGAEAVVSFVGPIRGVVMHALLLLGLLNSYALTDELPHRDIFLVLALAPLLRIFSLTIPIVQIPQMYWYAMIGVPSLIAVALIQRATQVPLGNLKLNVQTVPVQILIALTGLPLGVAGYLILKPKPLFSNVGVLQIVIGSLILFVFSAFVEEIIFRGMLQKISVHIFGPWGFICSNAVFTSMYLGSFSPTFVLFVCLVGFLFSFWVALTDTIWGAVGAHGLLTVAMLLVLPVVWR